MAVSIDIRPSSSTLCLLNGPDPSTAYSLSGHVSLTLRPPAGVRRPPKILLRSLNLVFEGQSEFLTMETGYASVRLCRLNRQLVPVHAMMLSADEENASADGSVSWNFVFDLPIPGWLPASSIFGCDQHGEAGTTYALYAEAKYTPLEETLHSRSWSLSTVCSPFAPRVRVARAPRTVVEVVRYVIPPLVDASTPITFPDTTYTIDTNQGSGTKRSSSPAVPDDVLQAIEVLATVPESIDLDDGDLKLVLRLRASQLTLEQQKRLRLTHFRVQFMQHETYRRQPTRAFASMFPLPPVQPEDKPLIHTHELKSLYELGFSTIICSEAPKLRSAFSLLPKKQMSGRHVLPDGGVRFAQEAHSERDNTWCRVDVNVPFERFERGQQKEWEIMHGRVKMLRPDEYGPLFYVHHELEVELTCTYDSETEGDAPALERLVFVVPVKFVRLPPTLSAANKNAGSQAAVTDSRDSLALPAYSQLYHSNGERKIDESTPLPLYTPFDPNNATISSLRSKLCDVATSNSPTSA